MEVLVSLPLSKMSPDVKDSFICIGDYLEIFPLFGRKKRLSLNRTHYKINEAKQHDLVLSACQFSLPCIEDNGSEYELVLIQGEFDSYLLRTVKGAAFKLNGSFCHEAYLQERDEVIVGHNKLRFKKAKTVSSSLERPLGFSDDLNILIEGETGVGKTTLAKRIHKESSSLGDFVHVNLSAFPPSLIESELFGHAKGAFTGAIRDKIGALEQAKSGTLFLDEIDSIPLDLQVKLLLFLDDYIVRPVGATSGKECRSRIIFASGSPLKSLVEAGRMRKDFFFRVSVGHKVYLPSLRECRETCLRVIEGYEIKNNIYLSPQLRSYLIKQEWPGNIRQLYGHLDKKRVLTKGRKLDLDDLDRNLIEVDIPFDDNVYLLPFREVKKRYFQYAFEKCSKDPYLAAKRISVSINTMKKFIH